MKSRGRKENSRDGGNKTLYFDELGQDFDRYMSDYDVERRQRLMFAVLLENCTLRAAKVLKVGCETGRFSEKIVQLCAELTVLDIGSNLVAIVSKRLSCAGVVGDACDLPFEDGSFDVVIVPGLFRQEHLAIDQAVELGRGVAQMHADHAVLDLPDGPAVLALDAGGLIAFLDESWSHR
jgi:SAM-dependent methyltransferase